MKFDEIRNVENETVSNVKSVTWSAAVLAGVIAFAMPSYADEAADEQFSEALSDFGYAGGAAWQCAEGAAKGDIERNAMKAYNGIVRLFGSDEAFFFASAFGGGTTDGIDKSKCAEFADHFKVGMNQAGAE